MGKDWQVFGVEEIINNLQAVVGTLKKSAIRTALRNAATVMRDEAKRQVPVRTGSLKKAIKATTARAKKNPNVPYIGLVKIDKVAFRKNEKGKLKRVARSKDSKTKVYRRGDIYPRNYDHLVERGASEHNLNSGKDGAPYKRHPGSKPNPFMRRAFFASSGKALEVFKTRISLDAFTGMQKAKAKRRVA